MDRIDRASQPAPTDPRRIVLVGPCASGKSTLSDRLRASGYDVHVCGQEHSQIRDFWRRMKPDVLVALRVDLETLRQRRTPTWPESLYITQRGRLSSAYLEADIVIDSAAVDPDTAMQQVVRWLGEHAISSA